MKVFEQQIPLKLSAAQVREFLMTPERILDYYPQGIDGFVVEPNKSIICRGFGGASLLEVVDEGNNSTIIKVYSALIFKPPFTAERIKAEYFFSMVEDWVVEEHAQGSVLHKTWRDIEKRRFKFLPMAWMVKNSAKKERAKLADAWNKAISTKV